jgi:phosphoribosylformylglycinamidine synthase
MKAVIQANEQFARLLGYYLSEGCVSQNAKTYKIIFTFALHETVYVNDVVHGLKHLGLHPCVEICFLYTYSLNFKPSFR